MAAKCLKYVGTFKSFKGSYFDWGKILPKHDYFFFLLVICSLQETIAGNTQFRFSKLYFSCQYKFVMLNAVLPFPTRNAFGRTQAALVMLRGTWGFTFDHFPTFGIIPLGKEGGSQVGSDERLWVLLLLPE